VSAGASRRYAGHQQAYALPCVPVEVKEAYKLAGDRRNDDWRQRSHDRCLQTRRHDAGTISDIANNVFLDTQTLPVSGTYTIIANPAGSATGNWTVTLFNVPADIAGQ